MCGILCLVSPEFKRYPPSLGIETDQWISTDEETIRRISHKDLQLSATDLNKLKYQDELQELNHKLIKLGNNVKQDNSAAILDTNAKIQQLIGTDEPPLEEISDAFDNFNHLISEITSRGPDCVQYRKLCHKQHIQMYSSVLSLRQPFVAQPIENERFILQFNGELYDYECEHSNDTKYLLERISHDGMRAFDKLNGEFAFVLLDKEDHKISFGRDRVGKRSLCFSDQDHLLISSASFSSCSECDAGVVYEYDLVTNALVQSGRHNLDLHPMPYCPDPSVVTEAIYSKLLESCWVRQETIHPLHGNESNIAVLFSGGLDCTILTAMICENFIEAGSKVNIDLLTVGFDNPRTKMAASQSPDRQLGRKSWFHLCKKYQSDNIRLRLVEVDVAYKDWLLHRHQVKKLMYPQDTEMDLSIAIAFYFASNNIYPAKKVELVDMDVDWETFDTENTAYIDSSTYMSQAKVLFSGLGADELFGGYSRHEAVFTDLKPGDDPQRQFSELNDMLSHDVNVIYKRNLGRDDRTISHWGKEVRYPYLDFSFVEFAMNEVPPSTKVKLAWTTTKKGNTVTKPVRKWALRQVAELMGLEFVQHELKRAIQFGAKSSKMEIGQSKTRGTDQL